MPLPLKLKKSAGIPVTRAVHSLLRRGNAARDGRDWAAAAIDYRAALDADPTLRHIWIQLGHMLKEVGRTDEAFEAYRTAISLQPADPETFSHIAHLYKSQGDAISAMHYFLKAIRTGDGNPAPLIGLQAIIGRIRMIDTVSLDQAARHSTISSPVLSRPDPAAAKAAVDRVLSASGIVDDNTAVLQSASAVLARIDKIDAVPTSGGVIFDVTDLIAHFRHHRLPTGIQRVQIEVVTRALRGAADVRICCFLDGRDHLLEIPGALFTELAASSTSGESQDAPEWTTMIARLLIHLLTAEPFAFRRGEKLVNLGTSWWIYNYYLIVRNAKREHSIRYIPFVHDLIPIMAADHCVTGVIEDYITWLVGVFDHADLFLVNSQSTGRDLMLAAGRLGRPIDMASIEVVPLNADFRQPTDGKLSTNELERWSLAASSYSLIVSTIESRKNHSLALDAWERLIEKHGADRVPMLVCVGRSGWLNGAFFERLNRNHQLRAKVKLIERVSDEELALLYRCCRFTVYPSHYEGWGLPVTESLCYGRVPVVADNSSLREAGGDFAVFFESGTVADLVTAIERMLFEAGFVERLEREITTRFRPRSWTSIAAQVIRAVAAPRQGEAPTPVPIIVAGRYYPTSLYKGTRIWPGLGSGEIFRVGTGWLWPDTEQCRTTAEGGTLRMRTPGLQGPLRLYLRLRGLDSVRSAFAVSIGGETIVTGSLREGEARWVLGDIPVVGDDDILTITVRGGSTEEIEMMTGGTPKRLQASVGVLGFALLERADEGSRVTFVQNIALEGLDNVNAYAETLATT
jgi:glycosyltransferase involved in cell wall biosynthesis